MTHLDDFFFFLEARSFRQGRYFVLSFSSIVFSAMTIEEKMRGRYYGMLSSGLDMAF